MKVHFIQLMKGGETAELETLKLIPGISVARCDEDYGFTFGMDEESKAQITDCHNRLLREAFKLAQEGHIDMLIVDEFNAAYQYDLVDSKLAKELVLQKPEKLELVLTGRNPAECFVEAADYISEIMPVKHPYEKGIKARKGIEF